MISVVTSRTIKSSPPAEKVRIYGACGKEFSIQREFYSEKETLVTVGFTAGSLYKSQD